MKKLFAIYFLFSFCLFSNGAVNSEMYKWVDEDGVIHFSDSAPEENHSISYFESMSSVESNYKPREGQQGITQPTTHHSAASSAQQKPPKEIKNAKVELYSTSWCGYCKKARNYFKSKGISITEYDIEKDKEAAKRKNRLDPKPGIPFAVVNGQNIHGYSEVAYERALKGEKL